MVVVFSVLICCVLKDFLFFEYIDECMDIFNIEDVIILGLFVFKFCQSLDWYVFWVYVFIRNLVLLFFILFYEIEF